VEPPAMAVRWATVDRSASAISPPADREKLGMGVWAQPGKPDSDRRIVCRRPRQRIRESTEACAPRAG